MNLKNTKRAVMIATLISLVSIIAMGLMLQNPSKVLAQTTPIPATDAYHGLSLPFLTNTKWSALRVVKQDINKHAIESDTNGANTYTYDFESGWSPCDWNTQFQFSHHGNRIKVYVNRCNGGDFTRNGIARLQIYNPGANQWQNYGFSAESSYNAGDDDVEFFFDPINERGGTNTPQRYRVVVGEDSNLPTGERRAWVNFFLPSTTSPFTNYTYNVSSTDYECLPNDGIVGLKATPQNESLTLSIRPCSGSPFQRNGEAVVYVDGFPYGLSQTYSTGDSEVVINIDPATQGFPNTQTHNIFVKAGEDGNLPSGAINFSLQEPDTTQPVATLTSPTNGATIGPTTLRISATASDLGGSGLNGVEFYVHYDNRLHNLGRDTTIPFEISWATPQSLNSQQIAVVAVAFDNAGNPSNPRSSNARAILNYVKSSGNPNVEENWVSESKRAYLNQRALDDANADGDIKCGATSMAMILAMNGVIASDHNTMAAKANEMYPNTLDGGLAYVYKFVQELNTQGVTSASHLLNQEDGWELIMQEIDSDRPLILRTKNGVMTRYGHIFVIVGYKEEGSNRQIIAYDPFGKWTGSCCQNNYDINTENADSQKGKWVYYNFEDVFSSPEYLITARPTTSNSNHTVHSPITPPDMTSDEPENIGTYNGIETSIILENNVFLPYISKP